MSPGLWTFVSKLLGVGPQVTENEIRLDGMEDGMKAMNNRLVDGLLKKDK